VKKTLLANAGILLLAAVMLYPLVWLLFASVKPSAEIFRSIKLLPSVPTLEGYVAGWKGAGRQGFAVFFANSFKLVVPTVAFTIVSTVIVAYGFARFDFPLRNFLFMIMISTLMLPRAVLVIPQFLLFKNLGWLNSYLPFMIPALFACYPFFIFLMVQFLRGIPRELDESAVIDGCNSFRILRSILLPLAKPAVFSVGIFQFVWTWNDFFNSLIYINSVRKYPVSLGLKMSLDTTSEVVWNQILAMSIVAMAPCVILFFVAQKHFVEGIATQGLKG
jgi:oligogalacturonide transport system permease protein